MTQHPTTGHALAYAAGYQCPDCDSEIRITEVAPGFVRASVLHDQTCPWLARLEHATAPTDPKEAD